MHVHIPLWVGDEVGVDYLWIQEFLQVDSLCPRYYDNKKPIALAGDGLVLRQQDYCLRCTPMLTSTRRFWARPSLVALLATGLDSPMPVTDIRLVATPLLAR